MSSSTRVNKAERDVLDAVEGLWVVPRPDDFGAAYQKLVDASAALDKAKLARLCTLCGLTCGLHDAVDAEANAHDSYGLIDATVSGTYLSTPGAKGHGALDNYASYTFSLCEFCLDWIFERSAIRPEVASARREFENEDEPFRPATVRVYQDTWRQDKATFAAEKSRRDKARTQALIDRIKAGDIATPPIPPENIVAPLASKPA